MTVARIINDKGRDVISVSAETSLAEIASILSQKRIGAVVVMKDEGIQGIISERDIIRALARHGGDALGMLAADWMTAKVVTCGPEDTIDDVMQIMTRGRFRHLPVVKHDKLIGIISIGDVVKRRIEQVEQEADQIREYIATA